LLPALVLTLILTASGCGPVMYFLWPFGRTVTIDAEFEGIENRTVAVVIFANETTQFEYPWAALNLSAMTSAALRNNVKGVTTIDPHQITAYQEKNIHWAAMDKTDLARVLKADYVLHVSLVEFTTAEEGFVDTLRGTVNGEIKLYDASKPESDACVYSCSSVKVQFPKTPTVRNARNEANIRQIIMAKFSDKLAKKFYTYDIPIEDRDDL